MHALIREVVGEGGRKAPPVRRTAPGPLPSNQTDDECVPALQLTGLLRPYVQYPTRRRESTAAQPLRTVHAYLTFLVTGQVLNCCVVFLGEDARPPTIDGVPSLAYPSIS